MPPTIQPSAFSLVSNPLRTYFASDANRTTTQADGTRTYSFTMQEPAIVNAFFASINIRFFTATAANDTFIVRVLRNDKPLFTATFSTAALITASGGFPGVIVYETLSFLAGSEVFQGEKFALELIPSIDAGASITFDASINLVATSKAAQFYG